MPVDGSSLTVSAPSLGQVARSPQSLVRCEQFFPHRATDMPVRVRLMAGPDDTDVGLLGVRTRFDGTIFSTSNRAARPTACCADRHLLRGLTFSSATKQLEISGVKCEVRWGCASIAGRWHHHPWLGRPAGPLAGFEATFRPSRSRERTTKLLHASSSRHPGWAFKGPAPSLPDGISAPSRSIASASCSARSKAAQSCARTSTPPVSTMAYSR